MMTHMHTTQTDGLPEKAACFLTGLCNGSNTTTRVLEAEEGAK